MLTEKHDALKEYGHRLLLNMGFQESEIHEEYILRPIDYQLNKKTNKMEHREGKQHIRIDIVGISKSRKVAIECGLTKFENLAWEKLFFDEVIVLPFFKMDTERVILERRIRELEKEVAENSRDLENKEHKLQEAIEKSIANSSPALLINLLVNTLISQMEGKTKVALIGWDHRLGNAIDSLLTSCFMWRDAYDSLLAKKR